jgi:hypothetical protein
MSLSISVRGAKAQGPRSKPATELNPAVGSSLIKEHSHGEEEEESKEDEVLIPARASYWGRAVSFGFREALVVSQSGRTEVRPLSFLGGQRYREERSDEAF